MQHHIIDPRTGQPAQTDVLSATVVAPSASDAGCAATSAYRNLSGATPVSPWGGNWPRSRWRSSRCWARHFASSPQVAARLLAVASAEPPPLLPELTDVELIWLDAGNLRLKGTELIDGAGYTQTWDVRVL